jgi:hypothetical protein
MMLLSLIIWRNSFFAFAATPELFVILFRLGAAGHIGQQAAALAAAEAPSQPPSNLATDNASRHKSVAREAHPVGEADCEGASCDTYAADGGISDEVTDENGYDRLRGGTRNCAASSMVRRDQDGLQRIPWYVQIQPGRHRLLDRDVERRAADLCCHRDRCDCSQGRSAQFDPQRAWRSRRCVWRLIRHYLHRHRFCDSLPPERTSVRRCQRGPEFFRQGRIRFLRPKTEGASAKQGRAGGGNRCVLLMLRQLIGRCGHEGRSCVNGPASNDTESCREVQDGV